VGGQVFLKTVTIRVCVVVCLLQESICFRHVRSLATTHSGISISFASRPRRASLPRIIPCSKLVAGGIVTFHCSRGALICGACGEERAGSCKIAVADYLKNHDDPKFILIHCTYIFIAHLSSSSTHTSYPPQTFPVSSFL
jgi:hypothetical protein